MQLDQMNKTMMRHGFEVIFRTKQNLVIEKPVPIALMEHAPCAALCKNMSRIPFLKQ